MKNESAKEKAASPLLVTDTDTDINIDIDKTILILIPTIL